MKNAITRGIKYLRYRKFKSLLLIAMMIVICSVTLISATVDSTIKKYYQSIDTTNGISVTAQPVMNFEPGKQPQMETNNITQEQLASIEALDYVTDVSNTVNLFVTSNAIQEITYTQDTTTTGNSNNMPSNGATGQPGGLQNINMAGLKVLASTHLTLESDFTQETVSLQEGNMPANENEVIISTTLATLNNLVIGDEFEVTASDTKVKLKVVGLYQYNETLDEMTMRSVPENTIYAGFDTGTLLMDETTPSRITTQYFIKDTSYFDQFEKDYFKITQQSKEKMSLTLNDTVFTSTIKPLVQLSEMFTAIKWIVLAIFLSILSIVSYLMIKERNYEIGVLYSLSESKRNIFIQFISESIILVTISFIISLILNKILSTSLINYLLNLEIFNTVKQGSQMMTRMPQQISESIDLESYLSVANGIQAFIFVLAIIILITILTIARTLIKRPKEIING